MATFGRIKGEESATTTFKVRTLTVTQNSSNMQQEILTIGDGETSNAVARVLGANPVSTEFGLAVRIVSGPSSAADHLTQISGNSTAIQGTNPWIVGFQAGMVSTSLPASGSSGLNVWVVGGARQNIGSTAADNAVAISGNSTVIQGTSPWVVGFQSGNISSVAQSGNSSGLTVRPVWSSSGKDQTIAIGGALDSSNNLINIADSANNAIKVNVVAGAAGGSTIVTVSSLPMVSTSVPSATSSGLNVWVVGGNRQTIGSTATDNAVATTPGSTAPTVYYPVRITDGSTWVVDYAQGSTFTSTLVGGGVNFLRAGASSVSSTDTFVMPWGSTFGHQIVAVTDSSQAIVYPADSANNAIRVNVVAGAAGGSTIVTVSAWGSGLISSGVAAGNSSALTVRNVWSSSGKDQPISIAGAIDSSNNLINIADSANNAIKVNVVAGAAGGSTIVTVSSLPMVSTSAPSATSSGLNVWMVGGNRLNIGSTAADNVVTVGSFTPTRLNIGSTAADNAVLATIGTNLQSTVAPSSGSSGLIVRPVIDAILTTASTNGFAASTSLSIQSSGAGLRSYVIGYSILSTNAGPHKIKFYSSGTMTWPVMFAAVSSAVSGANLAVSAPAYLFRTGASEALTLQLGSGASTIGGYQVAVSYFRAP